MLEEFGILTAAAALSAAGVVFAMFTATTARRVADVIAFLGGGVMLAVAALHLAPEVIQAGGMSRWLLIGGALVGVGLEALFQLGVHRPGGATAVRTAAIAALGVLSIHSMADGAVYGAAFAHNHGTGMLASLGLIFHEAPEGVVAFMLALQLTNGPRAAVIAILCSSLTTPAGWMLAQAMDAGHKGALEAIFAASAGLLLYVGWHLFAGGWKAIRRR